MSASCDVSVVIVNFNGKKYIDTLMESLSQQKHSDFTYEIIFVDNASTDESITYISKKYEPEIKNLHIVESQINLGFAGGNNLGVRHACGTYVALLNNDTKPDPYWLENLYHYISSRPDVVIANSKLLFFYDFIKVSFRTSDKILLKKQIEINGEPYIVENKFCKNLLYQDECLVCFGHSEICIPLIYHCVDYRIIFEAIDAGDADVIQLAGYEAPLFSGKTTELEIKSENVEQTQFSLIQNAGSGINESLDGFDIGFCQQDHAEFDREYELTCACGAAMIFRKEDFEQCGGFDERFFMYYEDTDLSFKMKKSGRKIMYCPSAVVRHVHAGSSGEWSPFFVYHVYKNKLLFIANHQGKRAYVKCFFKQLFQSIKEHDRNKILGTLSVLSQVRGSK